MPNKHKLATALFIAFVAFVFACGLLYFIVIQPNESVCEAVVQTSNYPSSIIRDMDTSDILERTIGRFWGSVYTTEHNIAAMEMQYRCNSFCQPIHLSSKMVVSPKNCGDWLTLTSYKPVTSTLIQVDFDIAGLSIDISDELIQGYGRGLNLAPEFLITHWQTIIDNALNLYLTSPYSAERCIEDQTYSFTATAFSDGVQFSFQSACATYDFAILYDAIAITPEEG